MPVPNPPQRDDEIFDVVDANDCVTGQATRASVHANNLLHRAVHIWIVRANGDVLLQKRSHRKDQYPSTWTSSASGHVDAGEDYEQAAIRELDEELGLQTPIRHLTTLPASPATAYEFTSFWVSETSETPKPNSIEVSRVEWWSVAECSAADRSRTRRI